MAKQSETPFSFSDRFGRFIAHNRKTIVIAFGVICAAIAVFLTVAAVREHRAKTASTAIEALIMEWTDGRIKGTDDMTAQEDALIEKLEKEAAGAGHVYAAFRAYTTLGEIYSLRKNWEKALAAYQKAGEVLPKTYTAGIAYFNAAACADELEQHEKALELYTLSAGIEDFPLRPRALFNVGRIEETLAHADKAIAAYTRLSELYPDNSWALLGKSRIIALSIQ